MDKSIVLKDDKSREQVKISDLLNLISLLGEKWENTNRKKKKCVKSKLRR